MLEIVRCGIRYRGSKNDPVTVEDVQQLNHLLAEIGFKIPELHDPKFLNGLPTREHNQGVRKVSPEILAKLKSELIGLQKHPAQKRGYEFQKLLGQVFEVFGLAPRNAFRIVGEEIDGSFNFQGETYLVEAKWHGERLDEQVLLAFSGKVAGKAEWSRGLMISYGGFSEQGLEAFARGKRTNIICMDALDLYYILSGCLDLRTVLERKVRRAAETNEAFVSVRELFSDIEAI